MNNGRLSINFKQTTDFKPEKLIPASKKRIKAGGGFQYISAGRRGYPKSKDFI